VSKYRIALLPGDGVGTEVMDAAKKVLDKIQLDAEYFEGDIGWEFWKTEGNALPERTVELIKNTDCALFGAITSKPKEEALLELDPSLQGKDFTYNSPIVSLRQLFDLYANVRPCKALPGNPLNYRDEIDFVVFRENTEGLYSGIEFYPVPEDLRDLLQYSHRQKMTRFSAVSNNDMAISLRVISRQGVQRIVRAAFDYAKQHGYSSVTVVEKPNVLRETSGLFVREARLIAKEYTGITLKETNIDAMCMFLLRKPQDYGVIVASNMFGDILSDLCAQLVGGLGFAGSANIGKNYAVFEPIHGSAPDIAGKGLVNPIAMIMSVVMMLNWFGEEEKSAMVCKAVELVVRECKVRTKDMGGESTTSIMMEEIVAKLQ